jgi:chorismate mutase
MGLSKLREEIDRIDRDVIALLRKRFEIVEEVAKLKRETNTGIEDGEREEEIIKNCKEECRGNIDETFVEKLMRLIIDESKKVQERLK